MPATKPIMIYSRAGIFQKWHKTVKVNILSLEV